MRDGLRQVADAGVAAVAIAFGMTGDATGIRPCPLCGREVRSASSADHRAPLGVRRDDRGWQCHGCQAHGDAVGLAAALVTGAVKPGAAGWKATLARCADLGLCDARAGRPPRRSRRVETSPRPPPARSYERPPVAEVTALWNAATRVTDDPAVSAWLRRRAIDVETVIAQDLARAITRDADCPAWARFRSTWSTSGYRLLVPVFGAGGRLESLRARRVIGDDEPVKEVAPMKPFEVSGLVMANLLGRDLLAGAATAAESARRNGVVVVEGSPDYLTASQWWGRKGDARAAAVLGIFSGAWTNEIAARIPTGATVLFVEHADKAGAGYLAKVSRSIAARCAVRRFNPAEWWERRRGALGAEARP